MRTAWLIGAYAADVNKPRWKTSQDVKLRKMILHEELRSVSLFDFYFIVFKFFQLSDTCVFQL